MNVKIECECGQHYVFDVEPANGLMESAVACPSCGADGTTAANAIIAGAEPQALFLPVQPPVEPAPSVAGVRLRVTAAGNEMPQVPAGVRVDARSLGLVNRETAEIEARAEISWGDEQEDVIKYLMLQGFSVPEAKELVDDLYKERLAALRIKGIGKIIAGSGMICVPVIAILVCMPIRFYPVKLLGIAVMVGLYGFWQLINGMIILVAPKMESGDVAEG
jgi:hypothetical protein